MARIVDKRTSAVMNVNKKGPCPCGSGKRYEQCCRKKLMMAKKAKAIFDAKEKGREDFVEQYGHIKIPQLIEAWGSMLTTVGGSVYKQTRPGNYNFVTAVHDIALLFFGEDYLIQQEKLTMEKRHPALQWMYIWVEHTQIDDSIPIGAGAAWLRFAYDIHTISDNSQLRDELRERILNYKRFQAARHELWTAALFVTANFAIDYEDESDETVKHPEFIATCNETGLKIAVEAKSRQRKGVKGFKDGKDEPHGKSVGIKVLVKKAYKKVTDLPFCIIVDTNLPPQSESFDLNYWTNDIEDSMNGLVRDGYAAPCPANLILFHNDPSHYILEEKIGFDDDKLWIMDYMPIDTKNPIDDVAGLKDRLYKANRQRMHPPVEIPDI